MRNENLNFGQTWARALLDFGLSSVRNILAFAHRLDQLSNENKNKLSGLAVYDKQK